VFRLEFDADGRPRTQGSHLAQRDARTGRVRVAPVQEQDLKLWRGRIRTAATLAFVDAGYPRAHPGPCLVLARFRLVRPQYLADTLDDKPATVVPDVDKLERALLDALTGLAWADDSQVIGTTMVKSYAGALERPGVSVVAIALDELEPLETPPVAILAGELDRWRRTW
jgi:crossover junction endodeoxyribonuclease RusA